MAEQEYLAGEAFAGQVTEIARDLIGRRLIVRSGDDVQSALILEAEAYGGADDPASHAAFRPGGRASVMYGPPGGVYIYLAYGVYPMFNIVTGPEGTAAAVLLRSGRVDGMRQVINGPGRLANVLGITLRDHGRALGGGRFEISASRAEMRILATPRIGITRGTDVNWRYVWAGLEGYG